MFATNLQLEMMDEEEEEEAKPTSEPYESFRSVPLTRLMLDGSAESLNTSILEPEGTLLIIRPGVSTVIGSGNSAHVIGFSQSPLFALKAFHVDQVYEQTIYEFNMHKRVYDLFDQVHARISSSQVYDQNYLLLSRTRVALADAARPNALVISDKRYNSFFRMPRLFGMQFSSIAHFEDMHPTLIELSSTLKRRTEAAYYERAEDQMVQLTLNNNTGHSGIVGFDPELVVGDNNPPRGYFLQHRTAEPYIDYLVKAELGSDSGYTLDSFKWLLGFCNGLLYWSGILPFDLEVAVGDDHNAGDFVINLMDFGAFLDLNSDSYSGNVESMYKIIRGVQRYENEARTSRRIAIQRHLENNEFEQKIRNAISKGVFIDLADPAADKGWSAAKTMAASLDFPKITAGTCPFR